MVQLVTNNQLALLGPTDLIQDSLLKVLKNTELGFTKLPFDNQALNLSQNIAEEILKNFDHLVLIGIGGSSMGARALTELSGSTQISFLDNVDSIETERILNRIHLEKTAWLVISKTGSTIEVLWTLERVAQHYQNLKKEFWQNTFYITEKTDNPLFRLSEKHKRPILPIPLNVGGRFSVLSPVGLVVAAYLKMNLLDLFKGAHLALEDKKNLNTSVQHYLASFKRNENISVFWFYNSNMRWFGCWLQQLWAESLGKNTTKHNKPAPEFSSPMISIGSCDQHSILQQIMEGPKNKFVSFFRFQNVETSSHIITETHFKETEILKNQQFGALIKAESLATEQALRTNGISTMTYELSGNDEQNLGYLFMFFQLIIATIGEISDIDAFNQPSVALSKKLTLDILARK